MAGNCHETIQKILPGGIPRQVPRASVSSVEGLIMPVFTFEKISPPIHRVPSPAAAPVAEKPRNVIIQILDRFVEARVKRTVIAEKTGDMRRNKPPA
jgi:hypothetical protein